MINPTSAPLIDWSDQYRKLVWLASVFGTDSERAWTHYSGFATIYFLGHKYRLKSCSFSVENFSQDFVCKFATSCALQIWYVSKLYKFGSPVKLFRWQWWGSKLCKHFYVCSSITWEEVLFKAFNFFQWCLTPSYMINHR